MSAAAAAVGQRTVRPLAPHEFRQFQRWIHAAAGIYLSDAKQALLSGRLMPRMRQLDLRSFGEYFDYVQAHLPNEGQVLLELVCTHETQFFRDARQFEFLARQVFPAWVQQAERGERPRRVRAWSAACSTGEEPYSLAMSLLASFPAAQGWEVEVLGTDLSRRVLARAAEATWPIERASEIPQPLLRRFMLRGVGAQQGAMRAGPELRAAVRLAQLNLHDATYPAGSAFDLVLCRNVLIYFDAESRRAVLERLVRRLDARGYLLLGHAESLNAAGLALRSAAPAVYARAPREQP